MTDDDRESLTAYLDGELDEAAEQTLETRLSQDPKLRAELDALKKTWSMLDYLPTSAPSTDFTNRTLDRLSLERRNTKSAALRRGWSALRVAAWATCACLALAAGVAGSAGYRKYFEKPEPLVDPDEAVIRNLRILERLPAYDTVDDVGFLKSLNDPDLFGDDGT